MKHPNELVQMDTKGITYQTYLTVVSTLRISNGHAREITHLLFVDVQEQETDFATRMDIRPPSSALYEIKMDRMLWFKESH
jgi:hypothetical protein